MVTARIIVETSCGAVTAARKVMRARSVIAQGNVTIVKSNIGQAAENVRSINIRKRSVQAKEKVTRNPARFIFDRRKPIFKAMNYSKAAQQRPTVATTHLKQREVMKYSRPTEVVCMSPRNGTLFTTTVEIPDNIASNNKDIKQQEVVKTANTIGNGNDPNMSVEEEEEENEDREKFQRLPGVTPLRKW